MVGRWGKKVGRAELLQIISEINSFNQPREEQANKQLAEEAAKQAAQTRENERKARIARAEFVAFLMRQRGFVVPLF